MRIANYREAVEFGLRIQCSGEVSLNHAKVCNLTVLYLGRPLSIISGHPLLCTFANVGNNSQKSSGSIS